MSSPTAASRRDGRPRSRRLWRIPARSRLARRRPHRRQLQPQRRGRRRVDARQRRRSLGGHAQRHRRADVQRPPRAAAWNPCSSTAAGAAPGACSTSSASIPSPSACSASSARCEQNPELTQACVEAATRSSATAIAGSTTACVPEEVEREHMRLAIDGYGAHRRAPGRLDDRAARTRTRGGFCPRPAASSTTATRFADELPYWVAVAGSPTSSSPTPTRPMTTASTRTTASRRARISSRTCATPSISSIARARGLAQADVHRPARPADRPAGTRRRPHQADRAHAPLRGRVVLPRHRHRPPLASSFCSEDVAKLAPQIAKLRFIPRQIPLNRSLPPPRMREARTSFAAHRTNLPWRESPGTHGRYDQVKSGRVAELECQERGGVPGSPRSQ